MEIAKSSRKLLDFIFLLFPLVLYAQTDYSSLLVRYAELCAEESDSPSDCDEWVESLAEYIVNPINLNDTVSGEIHNLLFLSQFQVDIIKSYIAQYGQMLSVNELYLLNGFDSSTIELLKPLVKAELIDYDEHLSLSKLFSKGHGSIIAGSKSYFEQSRGYADSIYMGSPLRYYFRFEYHYKDRVKFQFSGDKDPGEEFFSGSQPQGFDHYGFSLLLNNFGRIERAVVGQYQLQFGQGLTLWSGSAPFAFMGTSVFRMGQGIRQSSPFCEYGYLQGAAATFRLSKHLSITPFYSLVYRDATLDSSQGVVFAQSLNQTGYHRTESELSRRNNLSEQLFGAHLQFNVASFRMGITACKTLFGIPVNPPANNYNLYDFRGSSNANFGADFSYIYRNLSLFGEASMSQNKAFAAIAGANYHINANNSVSLCFRDYSSSYHNFHAAAFGQSGSPKNEKGCFMSFSTTLPHSFSVLLSADFFKFPWSKYRVYSPSLGSEYRIRITHPMSSYSTISLSYRYKNAGRNASIDSIPQYIVEQTTRQQLQTDIEYRIFDVWRLATRLGYVWFSCDFHDLEQGFLLYQDISFHPHYVPITLAARWTIFDVSDYDARLYAYESDFVYESATSVFQYQGNRFYAIVRYQPSERLMLGLKYGVTAYSDRDTFGSGYDLINTNHRQEWKVQLRWKF